MPETHTGIKKRLACLEGVPQLRSSEERPGPEPVVRETFFYAQIKTLYRLCCSDCGVVGLDLI